MTNLEYYKDEFVCMLKKSKLTLCSCFEALNNHDDCDTCPYNVENCAEEGLCNYRKFIDWLLEEHKEPIKLKQWEYDTIKYHGKLSKFNDIHFLMAMKNKGYFKDMNSVEKCSMTIKEILDNCEVIE